MYIAISILPPSFPVYSITICSFFNRKRKKFNSHDIFSWIFCLINTGRCTHIVTIYKMFTCCMFFILVYLLSGFHLLPTKGFFDSQPDTFKTVQFRSNVQVYVWPCFRIIVTVKVDHVFELFAAPVDSPIVSVKRFWVTQNTASKPSSWG